MPNINYNDFTEAEYKKELDAILSELPEELRNSIIRLVAIYSILGTQHEMINMCRSFVTELKDSVQDFGARMREAGYDSCINDNIDM